MSWESGPLPSFAPAEKAHGHIDGRKMRSISDRLTTLTQPHREPRPGRIYHVQGHPAESC